MRTRAEVFSKNSGRRVTKDLPEKPSFCEGSGTTGLSHPQSKNQGAGSNFSFVQPNKIINKQGAINLCRAYFSFLRNRCVGCERQAGPGHSAPGLLAALEPHNHLSSKRPRQAAPLVERLPGGCWGMVTQVELFGQDFQWSWTNSWAVSVPQGAGEMEELRIILRESNPAYGSPAPKPPHHLPWFLSY